MAGAPVTPAPTFETLDIKAPFSGTVASLDHPNPHSREARDAQ